MVGDFVSAVSTLVQSLPSLVPLTSDGFLLEAKDENKDFTGHGRPGGRGRRFRRTLRMFGHPN
jgi:hypothetical protein